MSTRRILKYPKDERSLRQPSRRVNNFDRKTRNLIADIKDTVLANPAVGLAAPQIGEHLQIIAVRLGQRENGESELSSPIIIINPEITAMGPLVRGYDGCLSIPRLYGFTYRPESLEVRGWDWRGHPLHMTFHGLDARVTHHEIDHLFGKLFIDLIEDYENDLFVIGENKYGDSILIPYQYVLERGGHDFRGLEKKFIAPQNVF